MKILVIEKEMPHVNGEHIKPHLKAEASRVWELYQKGIFREIYFDKERHTAVIIMECQDFDEAEEIMETLPLVKKLLITYELIALEPYSGFSRLFAESSEL